jgi:hypothetical protein
VPKLASDLKRKLSGDNPVLTVDLKEMFDLPFFPNSDTLRNAIGQEILDRIKENTLNGDFLESSSGAKKYSKEYTESFEFKVYHKQKDKVNLKASGDMLGSMELVLPSDANKVVIDFSDDTEAAKAHGHITGSVGKKRDFFGLGDGDMREIKQKFEPRVLDAMLAFQAGETLRQQADNQSEIDFLLQRISDGG